MGNPLVRFDEGSLVQTRSYSISAKTNDENGLRLTGLRGGRDRMPGRRALVSSSETRGRNCPDGHRICCTGAAWRCVSRRCNAATAGA